MKFFKKIGRIFILLVFVILASFGLGFGMNYRERYQHKKTEIELVQKKDEEEDHLEEREIKDN